MPRHIVDLAARSEVFAEQPLLSHAWVATAPEVAAFLLRPRSALRQLGIRLPASCVVETVLQNHDWLSGHSAGLTDPGAVTVFARGEGDGQRWYRVSFYASKSHRPAPQRTLLHAADQQERPVRAVSARSVDRVDSLRRSFSAAPIYTEVHTFLAPLTVQGRATKSDDESHRIMGQIVETVRVLVSGSRAFDGTIAALSESLQRQSHPGYAMVFRADRAPGATFHSAYTGVLYAKALQLLTTSGFQGDALTDDVASILANPQAALRLLTEAAQAQSPDFLVHATMEATSRRGADRTLDSRLGRSEQLFASYEPGDRGSSRFAAPARRLELFTMDNRDEWWFLPGLIAYAMAVWPLRGEQVPR